MRVRIFLLSLVLGLICGALPAAAQVDTQVQFADGLYREGMFDMAAREYVKILDANRRHPKASDIRLRLGDSYLQLGKYDEAAGVLKTLVDRDPGFAQYVDAAYRLGRALIESDRNAEAVRVLRRAEKKIGEDRWDDDLSQHVHYWLAEAFYRSDQFAKALAALDKILARRLDADIAMNARYTAGWAAYRSDQPERAIEHLRKFLGNDVDKTTAAECRYVVGECLFQLEQFDQARREYETAARTEGPYQDDALMALAWCDFELGERRRAAQGFDRVATTFPDSDVAATARLQAGISSYHAERLDDAVRHLSTAASLAAVAAEATYWLGIVAKDRGDLPAAVSYLERVKTDDSELAARVHLARGESLFRLERYQEALDAFARVGQAGDTPSADYALHASSLCRQSMGDHEGALTLSRQHLSQHPQSDYRSASLMVAGESLFGLDRFDEAVTCFATLLRDDAQYEGADAATYKLGWCLTNLDRHEEARNVFLQVQRYPNSTFAAESKKLAAQALARLGRADQAIQELGSVGNVGGSVGDDAMLEMARLKRESQDLAGSVDAYGKVARASTDAATRARARYEQAEVLYAAQQLDDAAKAYRAALADAKMDDLRQAARYGLAWTLYDLDRAEEAAREAAALIEEAQLDDELAASTLHLLGASHQRTGNWAAAVEAFERLIAEHPQSDLRYQATFGLGVCQAGAGQLSAAATTLANTVRRHPDGPANDRVLYELAFVLGDAEQKDQMVSVFRMLVKNHPDSPLAPEVLFRLGEDRYAADEPAAASAEYAKVIAHGAGDYLDRALYKKGWADKKAGDADAAIVCFGRLADECPRSTLRGEALYLKGELSREQGDAETAEKAYRAFLTEYPRHDLVESGHLGLALSLVDAGAWEAALRELNQHRQRYSKSERLFEVDFSVGRCLQALKRFPSAVQAFRRVTAEHRGETAARAQFEIGECFRAQSNFEDALSEYLKVRYLYGHEEWVAASMYRSGECFAKLGQEDRSQTAFAELIGKFPESSWSAQARKNGARTGL